MSERVQKPLGSDQVAEFYLDCFAPDQVSKFERLVPTASLESVGTIVDVGGGCGYFAHLLHAKIGKSVRVLDTDPTSIAACRRMGIEATQGDALSPPIAGDEEVVCFNLILHHLVGSDERITRGLQKQALSVWLHQAKFIFVSEYVYESFIGNIAGRLIYEITRNRLLSAIGSAVSKVIPSLRANTFGVGVRFRAHQEWIALFGEVGYRVVAKAYGQRDPLPLAHRLLLVRAIRRDGFVLDAA